MTDADFFALVGRVQNGFLCHATEETIRRQLTHEGIPEVKINAAISKGRRLADVRLGRKEV